MMRLLVLFVGLAMLATPARAADRNVVFFVADDHGTEALGAYGNRVVKTPSLDQLAHVLADLKARIKAFQERTGDPWVIKWRYE